MVDEQAPERALTLGSPLMVWTSEALNSVFAAGADFPVPVFSPGMFGRVRPPVDGVGVEPLDDPPHPAASMASCRVCNPPHPAIPTIAPAVTAPIRRCLMVIDVLGVMRQRSLRAESSQMIASVTINSLALPNRENDFTLVQSKQ